jgi:hypothetical protein
MPSFRGQALMEGDAMFEGQAPMRSDADDNLAAINASIAAATGRHLDTDRQVDAGRQLDSLDAGHTTDHIGHQPPTDTRSHAVTDRVVADDRVVAVESDSIRSNHNDVKQNRSGLKQPGSEGLDHTAASYSNFDFKAAGFASTDADADEDNLEDGSTITADPLRYLPADSTADSAADSTISAADSTISTADSAVVRSTSLPHFPQSEYSPNQFPQNNSNDFKPTQRALQGGVADAIKPWWIENYAGCFDGQLSVRLARSGPEVWHLVEEFYLGRICIWEVVLENLSIIVIK